jgi:uncharacterized protein with GYD domain
MTFGPYDFVHHYEAPNGEAIAKFVMTLSSFGNVRPTVMRAWDESEHLPLIRELSDWSDSRLGKGQVWLGPILLKKGF